MNYLRNYLFILKPQWPRRVSLEKSNFITHFKMCVIFYTAWHFNCEKLLMMANIGPGPLHQRAAYALVMLVAFKECLYNDNLVMSNWNEKITYFLTPMANHRFIGGEVMWGQLSIFMWAPSTQQATIGSRLCMEFTVKSLVSAAPNPFSIPKLKCSHLVMQLPLPYPLKPCVKSRMNVQLEQRRQSMLQLHLSDQQVYCLLRRD